MSLDGPRGARPDEVPAVVELADAIFGGGSNNMGPSFPTLFSAENSTWLRTFWEGSVPVAHVGIWRGAVWTGGHRLTVAHVGAVGTLPERRRQGLAGALLSDVLPRLRDDGVAVLFISGDRSLYRRLGARPFGHLSRYRVPVAALTGEAGSRTEPPSGFAALAGLYAAEPLHYERSLADWACLLPAKGYLPAREQSALCVWDPRGGPGPAAYLLLGRPRRPKVAGDGPVVLPVDEFAGDRHAVLAGLATALDAVGADAAELIVQPGDARMHRLLRDRGLPAEPCGHQGIARVLNFAAAASALRRPAPSPLGPLGDPAEAAAAGAWTESLFGRGGVELPRNDGLNYI